MVINMNEMVIKEPRRDYRKEDDQTCAAETNKKCLFDFNVYMENTHHIISQMATLDIRLSQVEEKMKELDELKALKHRIESLERYKDDYYPKQETKLDELKTLIQNVLKQMGILEKLEVRVSKLEKDNQRTSISLYKIKSKNYFMFFRMFLAAIFTAFGMYAMVYFPDSVSKTPPLHWLTIGSASFLFGDVILSSIGSWKNKVGNNDSDKE